MRNFGKNIKKSKGQIMVEPSVSNYKGRIEIPTGCKVKTGTLGYVDYLFIGLAFNMRLDSMEPGKERLEMLQVGMPYLAFMNAHLTGESTDGFSFACTDAELKVAHDVVADLYLHPKSGNRPEILNALVKLNQMINEA